LLCFTLYLILAALATFSLRTKNGRKFLNRVNHLLWKGCGPTVYSGIKYQILDICPTIIYLTFELITITFVHISLKLANQSLINQLAWFSIYLTRLSVIFQDHLANVIGRCLGRALREMNDEILAWDFSQKLFTKRNKTMTLMSMSRNSTFINSAAARFSCLSLALKELHKHYEFFWLTYIAHLSSVLIFTLALVVLNDVAAFTYLNVMFSSLTATKLINVCFLLGDASMQVSLKKALRKFYDYMFLIIVGGKSRGINWTRNGKSRGL
jgi:hypothetical protein